MSRARDHQPIEEHYRAAMNVLAASLDEFFNGKRGGPKTVGFALLTFEFGEIKDGQVNYISNADRPDMIAAMHEFLARAEGRYVEPDADKPQ
jgi:hypothetical protein